MPPPINCCRLRAVTNKYVLAFCCMWVLLMIFFVMRDQRSLTLTSRRLIGDIVQNFQAQRTTGTHNTVTERPRQECIHPQLKIDDPVMMKYFKKISPPKCRGEDWVYVQNGSLKFSPQAIKTHGKFSCDYYPLEREGDDKIKWGKHIQKIADGFNITTDFFRTVCVTPKNRTNEGIHAGVAYSSDRAHRKEDPLSAGFEGLSVAVLGFDSMSRMSWLRRLPKTRQYFLDVLGGIELEAHNIVGDGTTAVMFPMLTGKFEWELPECRRKFKGAKPMDDFPWLWHEMRKAGYLTSWCNGAPKSAPFNWRMLGFEKQPTDFYTRPFFLSTLGKKYTKHCMGARTLSQMWLGYFRDIFQMYKTQRKFLFHFITELSHDDNNLLTMMDADIYDLLKFLYEGKYLNNTVLILMGDHGARYNYVRSTWSGKLEERLPYFGFSFPPWFQQKYPQAIENLKTNTKRLTTPFDLYETFQDFFHFQGAGKGNASKRGISLFKEIPLERSCEHAEIAPHWCACLAWKNVSLDDPGVKDALQITLNTINNYTAAYRDDCASLSVANVTMATKLETRNEVLKFKDTDSNGGIYKINLSANSKNEMTLYQLTFYTTPGGGHFEVTVTYDAIRKKYIISEKEISRINKYGDAPACILDKNRQIRQYCYCKSNLKS